MLLISTILLVAIIGFKFIAALSFATQGNPEHREKFVLCCIPCYSEGADSLRLTIDSVATSRFDPQRMLMFIVADGMVVGSGNTASTPQILLTLLGVAEDDRHAARLLQESHEPAAAAFLSIGEGMKQSNRAKVFSGLYAKQGLLVPFVAVIKMGRPGETYRSGNRGKRDSQLLLMRFLGRVHDQDPMCPLELELFRHFRDIIGVHPSVYEYLIWVDADTEVFPDSINHFVSAMACDSAIVGICGETVLRNEDDSWVTMIQVYEYFISHHLAKAFESFFGSVTCLPGCFCMYRIFSTVTNAPVLVSQSVIADYGENNVNTLHLKNLLSLGEDRYLTTLMLKHFPNSKLKFTPDARAKTNAPNTWAVLISQRRRWMNSTVHNLFELLMLSNLCGFCVFSMRFVVFLDLFATVVQPAGFVYVVYLIVSLAVDEEAQIPLISLIMIAAIYGLQVVIFVIKREWQHIGWMIVYILAMPLYAFYLPLYAFWHFDDFSWGETRMVVDANGTGIQVVDSKDEAFDPASIPLADPKDANMGNALVMTVQPYAASGFYEMHSDRDVGDDDDDQPVMQQPVLQPATGAAAMPVGPTDAMLQDRIYALVAAADLERVTKRQIVEQLSHEYGMDMRPRTKAVSACIDRALFDLGEARARQVQS
ncbi:chitin synthase-domain-containing protein [Entophlyctis helioformis]|nr:chitin synthase-domain-containing protein [Entophlyctis helioformis]